MLTGIGTDSYDMTGNITDIKAPEDKLKESDFIKILTDFKGEIKQIPPKFSALKIKGRKAYEYARKGEYVKIEPRTTFIEDITLDKLNGSELFFTVRCSKGFYVRSLCNDIGSKLGLPTVMTSLRRTENSGFSVAKSLSMDNLPLNIDDHIITEIPEG